MGDGPRHLEFSRADKAQDTLEQGPYCTIPRRHGMMQSHEGGQHVMGVSHEGSQELNSTCDYIMPTLATPCPES